MKTGCSCYLCKKEKLSQIAKKAWRLPNGRFAKVVHTVKNYKPTVDGLEQRVKELEEKVSKLESPKKDGEELPNNAYCMCGDWRQWTQINSTVYCNTCQKIRRISLIK